jgi:hypothetical protein
MPQPPVAAEIHQPLDVELHFTTKVTLNFVISVKDVADEFHIRVSEFLNPFVFRDLRLRANRFRTRPTNSVKIRQGKGQMLSTRKINASDTCHGYSNSVSLTLLVARILADHAHDTTTAHDFALVADFFDARSYLHDAFLVPILVPQLFSFVTICDPAPRRVIRGYLDRNAITGQNLDVVLPHATANGRKYS